MTNVISPPQFDKSNYEEATKTLKGDGGGGTFDGMEPRIAKLEVQMDAARDDLRSLKAASESLKDSVSELKATVARIDAKLDSKIDYKWMTVYVLGIVAVIMREEIIGWFK